MYINEIKKIMELTFIQNSHGIVVLNSVIAHLEIVTYNNAICKRLIFQQCLYDKMKNMFVQTDNCHYTNRTFFREG